jgi:hypothetical protein
MKNSRNRAKLTATIVIVLLTASLMLMAMPVQAAISGAVGPALEYTAAGYPHLGPLPAGVTPAYTYATTAYMSLTPNPIGVGQQVLVNVWTCPGTMNQFYRQGYTVTIQKPDGTTDVIGPFNSYMADCTGWFNYVVDQVGTWKFKFDHPGTYVPAGTYVTRPGFPDLYPNFTLGASIYYGPSSTDWQELTVQQDQVLSWPSVPLPTDYWTRPISSENREWYVISGNYPWTGAYYYPGGRVLYSSNYKYTAYVQAPNTVHIVWRRKGADGGLIGADTYYYSLYTGGGNPSIIYAGRCYQTLTKVVDGRPTSVWECYDLRTGQVFWDILGVSAPTNVLYEPPAASITFAEFSTAYTVYLVAISGGRLLKYTPFTGAVSLNISLPSDLSLSIIYNNDRVLSLQTVNATASQYRLINWTMMGSSTNFTTRILTNVTWPYMTMTGPGIAAVIGQAMDYDAGIAAAGGWGYGAPQGYTGYADRGVSNLCVGYNVTTVDLSTGNVLCSVATNETFDTPVSWSSWVADRGRLAMGGNMHWTCFDERTGKILWRSDDAGYPWGAWWAYNTASYDFNESKSAIIGSAYDGIYAFDWDTGHILWKYSSPMPPFESPYGGEPFFTGVAIADGKVYAYGGEHSTTMPVTRGWHLHCINATTGELIWKITGPMSIGAIADGYLTASDPYDGHMYVFGKGRSATTVTAPDTVVAKGTSVVIKGTVMDMSPGDQGSVLNPTAPLDSPTKPGTVPCVSAASMETQMEYLYMQHPIDGLYHNETITGVPVILTAIGSDGTVIDIGSTTTNGYYGTFSMAWTPPKEDTYTIMASFAGDDSYGSSSAATGLSVGPAPASPTPTPEPPQAAPDSIPYIIGIGIAIIIAVAVATILILRKRA